MSQTLPDFAKLHDFIIARCRQDTGTKHLKDRNTKSVAQRKDCCQSRALAALATCPPSKSLNSFSESLNTAMTKEQGSLYISCISSSVRGYLQVLATALLLNSSAEHRVSHITNRSKVPVSPQWTEQSRGCDLEHKRTEN